jgi:hypothetical protein
MAGKGATVSADRPEIYLIGAVEIQRICNKLVL